MSLKQFVLDNQALITDIKERTPGQEDVDMLYGTLDYATSRFNTILLKLSQDRLLEAEHMPSVKECFKIIQDFYKHVQRYRFWPKFTKPFTRIILHHIGKKRIPKIKKLLETLNN